MSKKCNFIGCKFDQFGGGYCRIHQYYRNDKKIKPLRRAAIRKRSKKQIMLLGERQLQNQQDKLFYAEIWNERQHFCYETNTYLGGEVKSTFFHHILPKQPNAYPEYRYQRWNIVLVSLETHYQAESNLDFCPRIKKYHDYLIEHLDEIKNGILIPNQEIF